MDLTRKKLVTARLIAAKRWPHCTLLSTALPTQCRPGLGTMAVNGDWVLIYDPAFVEICEINALASVVQHEMLHLMLDHIARGEKMKNTPDWHLWNVACDLAVNSILVDEEWGLPPGALYPKDFRLAHGLSAEQYFNKLKAMQDSFMQKRIDQAKTGQDAVGSLEPVDDDSVGSLSPSDRERIRGQVKTAAAEADRGSAGANAIAQIDAKEDRTNRVSQALRRYMSRATAAASSGVSRRSYQFVNRRNQDASILLPGRRTESIDVCVMVDTSGSMFCHLEFAASAVDAVIRKMRLRSGMRVVTGDTSIEFDQRVSRLSEVKFKGCGGTDMRKMLAQVASDKPDVVILITDGDTPWPDKKPPFPVILLLCEETTVPSWLDTVPAFE